MKVRIVPILAEGGTMYDVRSMEYGRTLWIDFFMSTAMAWAIANGHTIVERGVS